LSLKLSKNSGKQGGIGVGRARKFKVSVNGKTYEVVVEELEDFGSGVNKESAGNFSSVSSTQTVVDTPAVSKPVTSTPSASLDGKVLKAPIAGRVVHVKVSEGDSVKKGEIVIVLEAMKMNNDIPSPIDGVVKKILVKEGETVENGQALIEFE